MGESNNWLAMSQMRKIEEDLNMDKEGTQNATINNLQPKIDLLQEENEFLKEMLVNREQETQEKCWEDLNKAYDGDYKDDLSSFEYLKKKWGIEK